MLNTFPKQNKLCGKLRIEQLYREGKRFVAWPLRVTWQPISNQQSTMTNTKVLVWAPKSLFKHAVQRNHLRRLMREAYRLHQDILTNQQSTINNQQYFIAFNYIDKEEQSFAVIEKAVCKSLKKIAAK